MREVFINWNGGIAVGGTLIQNLRYADDTLIIAANESELEAIKGINKTKIMIISRTNDNQTQHLLGLGLAVRGRQGRQGRQLLMAAKFSE